MTVKLILSFVCLLSLSALGIGTTESQIVRSYSPEHYDSIEQFEYEFEWLNGKIEANPYGTTK
ncbi:hypothetical protein [Paenibacillus sedimenti]|uniref:Uncharacterized protein n=1 Tax=Paenibacillus sedimenti TaxID=2770274 RepID=A0A926KS93_9BACL|nr:hypothetical protein [Paenibacillus sedimenti]MBD0381323.1 hypothetical protein [Paenibacillus sedimenti]